MLWGAQTQDPWEARREPWPEKPWQSCRHSQLRTTAGHRVGVWGWGWRADASSQGPGLVYLKQAPNCRYSCPVGKERSVDVLGRACAGPPVQLEGGVNRTADLTTPSKRCGQSSQLLLAPPPQASSPLRPEHPQGRFCARATSETPSCLSQAAHPGVSVGMAEGKQDLDVVPLHHAGRQTPLWASPSAPLPNIAVSSLGTTTSARKARSLLMSRPDHPGCAVLISCQCQKCRVLTPDLGNRAGSSWVQARMCFAVSGHPTQEARLQSRPCNLLGDRKQPCCPVQPLTWPCSLSFPGTCGYWQGLSHGQGVPAVQIWGHPVSHKGQAGGSGQGGARHGTQGTLGRW